MINNNDLIPGCSHFKWRDALFLPSWNVCHIPSLDEVANLTKAFQKMEIIRSFLGDRPINVHCALRPILNAVNHPKTGYDYNSFVGGSPHSAHKVGLAVDFDVSGLTCDEVKAALLPKLEELDIRMENNSIGASWVHVDLAPVPPGGHRYFIP